MSERLAVLYRGPLDSCNYACAYCPFSKRPPLADVMARDRACLERFVAWAVEADRWALEILFTPYGEALLWPWYQDALVRLSHADTIRQVSIQTNGSGPMTFLERADRSRVSLWVSFHPTEIAEDRFVRKMADLVAAGTRLSVGAVAAPEHLEAVESLRRALPHQIPMWINAQKPARTYGADEAARWQAIDPAFDFEARRHVTRGRPCLTGEDTISVDGDGLVRRCHFVDDVLGNLYEDDLGALLRPRVCPRPRCDCWIGYVNLPDLELRKSFDPDVLLARIRSR